MTRVRRAGVVAAATFSLCASSLVVGSSAGASGPSPYPTVLKIGFAGNKPVVSDTTLTPKRYRFNITSAQGDHTLQLLKLHSGYSLSNLVADGKLADGNGSGATAALQRLYDRVSFFGGLSVPEGKTGSMWETLYSGTYYAVDFDDATPTTAEAVKIRVSGSSTETSYPPVTNTVAAVDFGWHFSKTTFARSGNIRLKNSGKEPHFMLMGRVKPGTTRATVQAWINDQMSGKGSDGPPAWFIGPEVDTALISAGSQFIFHYTMPAGRYVVLCFAGDDDRGGLPHAFEGMYALVDLV